MTTESLTYRHSGLFEPGEYEDAIVDVTRTINNDGTVSITASARPCEDGTPGAVFLPWEGGETTYAHTFPAGTFDDIDLEDVINLAVQYTD